MRLWLDVTIGIALVAAGCNASSSDNSTAPQSGKATQTEDQVENSSAAAD